MIASLKDGTIDVAIALTESLIAGIAKGADHYKLVGQYVVSPLNWAVITGKDSKYQSIADHRGTKLGFSRIGSGSPAIASVMAMKHGWYQDEEKTKIEPLDFQVNDTFKNLRDSVNEGTTSCFMWEWYTTKPYKDNGEVRFIGSVITPWPSWMIAASPNVDAAELSSLLDSLSASVREFDSVESRQGSNIDYIINKFKYDRSDVQSWLTTVKYPTDLTQIKREVVFDTLKTLETAGVVKEPKDGWKIENFVNESVAKVL